MMQIISAASLGQGAVAGGMATDFKPGARNLCRVALMSRGKQNLTDKGTATIRRTTAIAVGLLAVCNAGGGRGGDYA